LHFRLFLRRCSAESHSRIFAGRAFQTVGAAIHNFTIHRSRTRTLRRAPIHARTRDVTPRSSMTSRRGGHLRRPTWRETSVHAAATPKHNSSSYKAQEAAAPDRPSAAERARDDRPRRSEDRWLLGAVAVRDPVRLVSTRAATSGTRAAASALRSCRRPGGGGGGRRAFHQSLTLNI